jgi:pentatricopeptide repeat protein
MKRCSLLSSVHNLSWSSRSHLHLTIRSKRIPSTHFQGGTTTPPPLPSLPREKRNNRTFGPTHYTWVAGLGNYQSHSTRKRSHFCDSGSKRFFSDNEVEWERVKDRVIETIEKPKGDLTPEDWYALQDDMELLIQNHSVKLCFRVLNRLAEEQALVSSLTRAAWVNGDLLKRILKSWMRTFYPEGYVPMRNSKEKLMKDLGPVAMPKIVDAYCKAFHEMKWSSQTAYYIVAAYNAHVKSLPNTTSDNNGPNTLEFARDILDIVMNEWRHGNQDAKPAPELLQAVANACTSRSIPQEQRRQAALQVDDLLLLVAQELDRYPDSRLYSTSVNAWALTRSIEGAETAYTRLDQMWEGRNDVTKAPGWVWVNALRSAIQAWAWSEHPNTLHRVDALLALAHNFIETKLIGKTDTMVSVWNAALQAFATVGTPEAATEATKLVSVLTQANEVLDKSSHYWYIACLVNGDDVEKGEEFLLDLIRTNRIDASEEFLSMVVRGWARSSHEGKYQRASNFMNVMETLSQGRVAPTTRTYNSLLECCATNLGDERYFAKEGLRILMKMRSSQLANKDSLIAPDLKSFTSVIKSLARCGDFKRAEALYEELWNSSKKDRDHNLRPDTVIFNAVLSAFNNSADETALSGALKFFQKCLARQRTGELPEGPDSYSFTTLVSCINRSVGKRPSMEERAEIASSLLQQLQSLYTKEGRAKWRPTTPLYNSVMHCWAKAGSVNNCEAILEQMLVDYEEGNDRALPTIQSFNILFDALAASNDNSAPVRADDLFAKIKELHQDGTLLSGPNLVTYTSLMHCHIKNGGEEGVVRARALYKEAQEEYEKGNLKGDPKTDIKLRNIHFDDNQNTRELAIE